MFRTRAYRYENEQVVLILTILLVLGVIILTSTATFCLSAVFILGMFLISAVMIHSHHQSLMQHALRVDRARTPELANLIAECGVKLQPGQVDVFVVNQKQMNAYTFGISSPKVLVLFAPLVKTMTVNELKFIIGHEMGHVVLGHTWLNTIIGGMAGIPAPFGAAVILFSPFAGESHVRIFSRSSGVAGLRRYSHRNFGTGRLAAPKIRTQADFESALAMIDAEDDPVSNRLAELFQSHPMLIRRINTLRDYARSTEYQRIQTGINGNLGAAPSAPAARFVAPVQLEPETSTLLETELTPEERWHG